MKVIYSGQPAPETINKSIFLAGPTPRSANVQSWRPEALTILELLGYDGVVFVPENPPESHEVFNEWGRHGSYNSAVGWEQECLKMADCILFWIPRNLDDMPAFTTNDEWGTWKYSGKTVLGAPKTAPKVKYQKYYAEQLKIPFAETLAETVKNAVDFVKDGSDRNGGERFIPLMIWNTESFQSWYLSHRMQSNRLDGAEVLWNFRVGKDKKTVFAYTIHADIYVAKEKRNKKNEFVFFRTDISSILLYRKSEHLLDTEIILVKEFRSPVRNFDGFVWELPGGSSFKENEDKYEVALSEVFEETGLKLSSDKLSYHGYKQVAATVSSHCAHIFSAELSNDEIMAAKEKHISNTVFGNIEDSEQTYVRVVRLHDILNNAIPVDWSTIGMIMKVLYEAF